MKAEKSCAVVKVRTASCYEVGHEEKPNVHVIYARTYMVECKHTSTKLFFHEVELKIVQPLMHCAKLPWLVYTKLDVGNSIKRSRVGGKENLQSEVDLTSDLDIVKRLSTQDYFLVELCTRKRTKLENLISASERRKSFFILLTWHEVLPLVATTKARNAARDEDHEADGNATHDEQQLQVDLAIATREPFATLARHFARAFDDAIAVTVAQLARARRI